jgi:signal transduction histidine kinase
MPGGGEFTLSTRELNFEIESLLDGDKPMVGACAFISLADTGVGIDGKIKEKIFEPFFTTKTNGTGLGLPIAYRIIKQHQGKINVESQAGQGTEVNIYLPLTTLEIVNMMTIPLDLSCGRIN